MPVSNAAQENRVKPKPIALIDSPQCQFVNLNLTSKDLHPYSVKINTEMMGLS